MNRSPGREERAVGTDGEAIRVRVLVNGIVRTGEAVDLRRADVEGETLVRAIRGRESPATVHCPEPGPVHERVGHVAPEPTVRIRAALSSVARDRGLAAPQDEELARLRRELADLEVPDLDLGSVRGEFAAVDGEELAALREEVAASRGAVQARLELGADVEPAREALSEAAATLAEVQTERIAAEQRLRLARRRAREARDARERRLRLQDRTGNLERAAREHLAGRLREEFAAAVEAVPGEGRVPGPPASFEGADATAALALARVADLRAPVVLACDRFPSARAAAATLEAPVIRV